MHMPLPDNTGTITKLSVSWLYGVIVCKTLSDLYQEFPYSQDKSYIHGIYTAFRLFSLSYDERSRRDWLGWIKIYEDAINHGYNAAS
jgi:hypothetical protein